MCRGHLPVTHFLMSGAMVMLSGQAQVYLGERWLIRGAGRHRNSHPPFILLLSLHQFLPKSGYQKHYKSQYGHNIVFVTSSLRFSGVSVP